MKKYLLLLTTVFAVLSANAEERNKIIVLSDTHLSDSRAHTMKYCWNDTVEEELKAFLDELVQDNSLKTLVLNGDIIDMWVSVGEQPIWADAEGNAVERKEYVKLIRQQNEYFFKSLEELKNDGVDICYIPGNHDMNFTAEDWEYISPGLVCYQSEAPGVGTYYPYPDIAIEHGHRYCLFTAPDPISHKTVYGADAEGVLPLAVFTTKLASSLEQKTGIITSEENDPGTAALVRSMVENAEKNPDTNEMRLSLISIGLGIMSNNFKDLGIDTYPMSIMADDLNGPYYWSKQVWDGKKSDLFPEFYSIANWASRCEANKTLKPVSFYRAAAAELVSDYVDEFAFSQMLDEPACKVKLAIFGHTHARRFMRKTVENKGEVLYVNPGSWTNPGRYKDTRSYVEVKVLDNGYDVALNRYAKETGTETLQKYTLVTDPSAIKNVNQPAASDTAIRYNLQGVRVDDSYKGICIENGRKILVK
ncbi:MAG: metallophosphoesterase family protein [Bacteroidaceae bacterium]|nr:metallophosphoesterase family protein [Bacteroidaceae bacterium]